MEDATVLTVSIVQDLQRFLLALLHLLPPGPKFLEVLNDGVRGHRNLSHYGVTLDGGAMKLRCDVRERGDNPSTRAKTLVISAALAADQ